MEIKDFENISYKQLLDIYKDNQNVLYEKLSKLIEERNREKK
jgi:hypothetical protein